jgi:hypothetical protein
MQAGGDQGQEEGDGQGPACSAPPSNRGAARANRRRGRRACPGASVLLAPECATCADSRKVAISRWLPLERSIDRVSLYSVPFVDNFNQHWRACQFNPFKCRSVRQSAIPIGRHSVDEMIRGFQMNATAHPDSTAGAQEFFPHSHYNASSIDWTVSERSYPGQQRFKAVRTIPRPLQL